MIYQIDQLVNMTRVLMSRHTTPRPLLHCHDPDTLRLNAVITSVIEEAAREIYREAPVWMLAQSALNLDDEIYWYPAEDGTYSGHLLLPDDYCRLYVLEMSDWRRCVYDAAEDDTLGAATATSPWSGIRGNPWSPRCVVRRHSTGRVLVFHSCETDSATIVQGQYIPMPTLVKFRAEEGPSSQDKDALPLQSSCGMEISQNILHHVLRRTADKALNIILQQNNHDI